MRRLPEKARYDARSVYEILDEAPLCYVAGVLDGRAVCLPHLCAREGRRLYLHGSQSNALLAALVEVGEAWISASTFDGLRLARSGFESSIAYRSVAVSGRVEEIVDETEKERVLDVLVDAVLPGRAGELRRPSARELRLTRVIAVNIDEASAKVSEGPTDDDEADQALAIWSGVVPARLVFDEPVASHDGAMAAGGVEVPASVRRLLGR